MQNAIDFYRYYGEDEKITNDSFSVIDEVYDCSVTKEDKRLYIGVKTA